jgi:gliding motility-associated-like protein
MKLFTASISLLLIHFASYAQISAGFTYDDTICVEDCIQFTNTSTGTITAYGWVFNGGNPAFSTSDNPGIVCYDTPGDYDIELTVTGPSGTVTTIMPIRVGIYPDSIFAYYDTTIEMGGTAYIFAEGYPSSGSYNWVSTGDFNCTTPGLCFEIYPFPLVTSDYIIEYEGDPGCIIRDTVKVTVKYIDVIDVPNSFSPDDNAVNDKVYVKGPGIVDMTFRIFDRYGRKMFETANQKEGWDGFFKGEKLNPGTFMWTLEYTLIDGSTNIKSGSITLVK